VPADLAAATRLARRYRSVQLGALEVHQEAGATRFDFGGWSSDMATRRSDNGAVIFITVSPGEQGFEFAIADQDNVRRLIVRDDQHEYVFTEKK
jgi:hypothetical protein